MNAPPAFKTHPSHFCSLEMFKKKDRKKNPTNCATMGGIYFFQCQSGCFYVSKTIRQLRVRVLEHVYSISIGDLRTALGRHAAKFHKYQHFDYYFFVLENIP